MVIKLQWWCTLQSDSKTEDYHFICALYHYILFVCCCFLVNLIWFSSHWMVQNDSMQAGIGALCHSAIVFIVNQESSNFQREYCCLQNRKKSSLYFLPSSAFCLVSSNYLIIQTAEWSHHSIPVFLICWVNLLLRQLQSRCWTNYSVWHFDKKGLGTVRKIKTSQEQQVGTNYPSNLDN